MKDSCQIIFCLIRVLTKKPWSIVVDSCPSSTEPTHLLRRLPIASQQCVPSWPCKGSCRQVSFIFSKSENINPSDLHKKWRLRWKPRLSRDCVECLSIKYWGHIQQGSDCQFGCLFRQLWIVRIFLLKYKIAFSGYNMGLNPTKHES